MRTYSSQNKTSIKKKILASPRNWLQLIIFILTLSIGFQFYMFVFQAGGDQAITVPRPGGVEAFLPIGALMGWKHFITTGIWDTIHPASMVFILFAVFISFIFRKAFCSWFCPVGTLSEWLWKVGELTFGRNYLFPKWIDLPLRCLKYLLLAFFVFIIVNMSTADITAFLESPYYKVADVKMLHFFTKMTHLTAMVLIALTVLSVIFRNFWCRYACPYGALLGIFARFSPTRVHRHPKTCTNCGKCSTVCPYHLPVDKQTQIVSPACSGCMDCVNECPSPDTLHLKSFGTKKAISAKQVGLWIIILFWGMIYTATITGHWKSRLTDDEFRMWVKMADTSMIKHPSTQFRP